MKLAVLFLLAWPLCAQTDDGEVIRQKYLKTLSAPGTSDEAQELSLESELLQLPAATRLQLAVEFAARQPKSAVLKAALAKALCANGQKDRALRILASTGFNRRDVNLQHLQASAWEVCGESGRAVAVLAELVKAAGNPSDALRALESLLGFASGSADRGVVDALKAQWRQQVDAGSKDCKVYRLLAGVYSWQLDPALVPLCEEAMRLFPQDAEFPDLLAKRLLFIGDWQGAEALRLDRLRTLKSVRARDLFQLADVYVFSGRLDVALEKLREGLADARLFPPDKAELEDKILVLETIASKRLSEPQAPACAFQEQAGSLGVDCGGQRLTYSLQTGLFTGQDDAARAVPLACRLMERVEDRRFSEEGRTELPAIAPDVREMLKAAGYLSR